MLTVRKLLLIYVAASLSTIFPEWAAAEFVMCVGQTEPSTHARSILSKDMSLMQLQSIVKKTGPKQAVSPVLRLIKTKVAAASKARASLVQTNASRRRSIMVQVNVSSRGHSLVQANASSRGRSTMHRNASGGGSLMVQRKALGNGAYMVQIDETGSREPKLQKRLPTLAPQRTGFRNDFSGFFHRLVRSQGVHTSTGVWTWVSLLSVIVISCFAACMFISGRSYIPVPASTFLRGTPQRATLSSAATPEGMRDTLRSPAALTTEPLASRLLLGAGAEAVSSVPSAMQEGAVASHDGSLPRAPIGRNSMVFDDTLGLNPYHICRDLVVPPGCECVLKVPLRCLSHGPFEVCDPSDNTALRVEPRPLHQAGGGAEGLVKLDVTTEFGIIVAQCRPSPARIAGQSPEQEQRECVLSRASGDLFAVIKMEEEQHKRYMLTTKLDGRLHILGSHEEQTLNFWDSTGKLVAKSCSSNTDQLDFIPSEVMASRQPNASSGPDTVYVRLKVAPLMDVGLVLSALLCIHHLM